MLSISPGIKIYVYQPATDMRKGVNGLSGLVRSQLQADPTDGSLFVFVNRRRDRMKMLYFDGAGFWLYYRLLEAGTFEELKSSDGSSHLTMDATELSMLLSGVSLVASRRRRKRYSQDHRQQAA
jgi:transposase